MTDNSEILFIEYVNGFLNPVTTQVRMNFPKVISVQFNMIYSELKACL